MSRFNKFRLFVQRFRASLVNRELDVIHLICRYQYYNVIPLRDPCRIRLETGIFLGGLFIPDHS